MPQSAVVGDKIKVIPYIPQYIRDYQGLLIDTYPIVWYTVVNLYIPID